MWQVFHAHLHLIRRFSHYHPPSAREVLLLNASDIAVTERYGGAFRLPAAETVLARQLAGKMP